MLERFWQKLFGMEMYWILCLSQVRSQSGLVELIYMNPDFKLKQHVLKQAYDVFELELSLSCFSNVYV